MTDATVMDLLRHMLMMAAMLGGPLLLVALVVGVGISILQAITQVQDMTLTFVPKLLAMALALLLLGSWMLQRAVTFTQNLYQDIPHYLR